jgi:hypothetical protein
MQANLDHKLMPSVREKDRLRQRGHLIRSEMIDEIPQAVWMRNLQRLRASLTLVHESEA